LRHRNLVGAVMFTPDGRALLTGSADNTAQLWSVPDGQPLGHALPHQSMVASAAFSADGGYLSTVQWDGLVRVWARPRESAGDYRAALDGRSSRVVLDLTGRYLPATSTSQLRGGLRGTQVYEVRTGEASGPALRTAGPLLEAAFA